MKLIRELNEEVSYITETTTDGKKHLYIEGIALQAGIKNRNNRIYPPPVLQRECERYIKEHVNNSTAYGQFGHPPHPKLDENLISHRIVSLKPDGNNWIGKAVVLDEGPGKIVRSIMETGGKIGVSSRGLGSLKFDEKLSAHVVQDDYKLMVGYDIVLQPSAPDSVMSAMMESATEWRLNEAGEWVQEQVEQLIKTAKKMTSHQLEERQLDLFSKYMSLLAKGPIRP